MREQQSCLKELLPHIQEELASGKNVRIIPGGNSMLPMLHPGRDTVILSPLPERLKKYDLPLYRRSDGKFVLHRIVEVGDTYTCVGDNQFQTEHGIRPEQMIALVTGFIRNGKERSVRDPGYRLYCRIWHYSRKLRHVIKWPKFYLRRLWHE